MNKNVCVMCGKDWLSDNAHTNVCSICKLLLLMRNSRQIANPHLSILPPAYNKTDIQINGMEGNFTKLLIDMPASPNKFAFAAVFLVTTEDYHNKNYNHVIALQRDEYVYSEGKYYHIRDFISRYSFIPEIEKIINGNYVLKVAKDPEFTEWGNGLRNDVVITSDGDRVKHSASLLVYPEFHGKAKFEWYEPPFTSGMDQFGNIFDSEGVDGNQFILIRFEFEYNVCLIIFKHNFDDMAKLLPVL